MNCIVLLVLNTTLITVGLILLVTIILMLAIIMSGFKKVPQGNALIRTGVGGTKVAINHSLIAFPLLHSVEVMDITIKAVKINRLGKNALRFKNNVPVDMKVSFIVGVNHSVKDIRNVAQNIGAAECSKMETLLSLFETEFSEALTIAAKDLDIVKVVDSRDEFKSLVSDNVLKQDSKGYYINDFIINSIEKTPNIAINESKPIIQEPQEIDSVSIQNNKS